MLASSSTGKGVHTPIKFIFSRGSLKAGVVLSCVGLVLAIRGNSSTLLTFDELSSQDCYPQKARVPQGYGGLLWRDFWVWDYQGGKGIYRYPTGVDSPNPLQQSNLPIDLILSLSRPFFVDLVCVSRDWWVQTLLTIMSM